MQETTVKHQGYEFRFTEEDVIDARYNFVPDGESNPHNVRPWLFHDHGFVLCVVFADCESDAIDEAVDSGKLDRFKIADEDRKDYNFGEESDDRPEPDFLGNASEAFDIEGLDYFALHNPPFSFCALYNAMQAEEKAAKRNLSTTQELCLKAAKTIASGYANNRYMVDALTVTFCHVFKGLPDFDADRLWRNVEEAIDAENRN